ncbi:hypothetical protein GCM10009416_20080 [Craurococcus roseus]|uniref:DUF4139 domain-containing protein n=1 Tax=Craurococcus roseus TaxID=77585 RepID=A0ABP3Q6V6_9PROT
MRLAIASALCFAAPAMATELPVRAVTLSNAGLALVEHAGALAPDEPIALRVPVESVDDVLKSLLLRDPAGVAEGVRLPARDLEREAFRGLPLRPEDFADRASLLRALRGQRVSAGGATGRLADAEGGEGGTLRLSLLTEAGLRLLVLREGDEVRLADAAMAARLDRAAEALAAARTADERVVEVRLRGAAAPREVGFAYVAGAPLWKPSWRLVVPEGDGEARLQGWAVVENRSGSDWNGIRLSLVSGNPAAFRQSLYAPLMVQRPELPVRAAERVDARPDTGARPAPPAPAAARAMAAGPAQALRMGAAPEAEALPVAPVQSAEAASAGMRVAFTVPAPVSVRSGETANIPFLDAAVPSERLWWVQDVSARHPLNAVRLRNATGHPLPDGLATLYDAVSGAHLGDAEIRMAAPGETRLLGHARDRGVLLSAATHADERPARIERRPGSVVVLTVRREETALAIDPRGARGRVVVDLPRRPGAEPRFPVAEEGDFGLRHEAALDGAAATLRFAWEREGRREMPLWDAGLGDPVLLDWRNLGGEDAMRRLPGGPGTVEGFRPVLERLPADAPGRALLENVVRGLEEARRLLDAAREPLRRAAVAQAALDRARQAAEDRTGAEREEARRRLNAASLEFERAGAAADAAWEAWRRKVAEVLALGG